MVIAEFPQLCIDDFRASDERPLPELCILSHMHEDHTLGLARKSYHGPVVYCTAATKAMVLNFRSNYGKGPLKYNHLRKEIGGKEILQALELNKPYALEYPGGPLQVTLIDANHCPGAAMVLVQSPGNSGPSVLFTGDVRCERWHLDALIHNPALFTYSRHLCDGPGRKWLSLYVDNTFLSHSDPYKSYGENYDGILQLASLLKTYPDEVHFCIADRTTGYEEVLIALSQQLHTRVHMDAYFFSMYSAAAATSPLAAKLIERASTELGTAGTTRLHYCHKHNGCPMRDAHAPTVYFKPCNQPSEQDVQLQNMQLPFASVRRSALSPFEESSRIYLGPEQRYYKDERTQKFYPLFPWFYFSRHSSFPELRGLCDLFNVTTVRSLQGVEIACLARPPAAAAKRSHSVMQESPTRRGANLTDVAVSAAVQAHKAVLLSQGMLPVYKKQLHARARKRRRQEKNKYDDSTDDDETERHEMLELLNRRSMREESRQRWRASVIEKEKSFNDRSDTQEFDKQEMLKSILSPRLLPEECKHEGAPATTRSSPDLASPGDHRVQEHTPVQAAKESSEQDTVPDSSKNHAQLTVQDPDSSSLLSPPPSPPLSRAEIHDAERSTDRVNSKREWKLDELSSRTHIRAYDPKERAFDELSEDLQVIDETPTAETLLAALEQQIRSNPCSWFSFTFDYLNEVTARAL